MIGIDTNVLVRYIAQDDAKQSALATRCIEQECSAAMPGYVALVVLVELVWVIESNYAASRAESAEVVSRLLSSKQFMVEGSESAWKAVRLLQSSRADFADWLIHTLSVASGCDRVMTFDKPAGQSRSVRDLANNSAGPLVFHEEPRRLA